MKRAFWVALFVSCLVAGCASKSQIEQTINENPDLIFNALNKNPDKFVEALNKAAAQAQEKQAADDAKSREDELKHPKQPSVSMDRAIRGNANAPITIVEYSDFQCPYCRMGAKVIEELREKYGEKLRVIYKHLPLDFHEMAMPAARYFEAIALQSPKKAYAFHIDPIGADCLNRPSTSEN